jgi:hypothetical protein
MKKDSGAPTTLSKIDCFSMRNSFFALYRSRRRKLINLAAMSRKAQRINYPRQLGDWPQSFGPHLC